MFAPLLSFLLHPAFLGINQRSAWSCPESLTCFLLPGLHQTSQTDKREHSAAGNLGVFNLNSKIPLISQTWPRRLTWEHYTKRELHSVRTGLGSSVEARLTPTVLPWFRYLVGHSSSCRAKGGWIVTCPQLPELCLKFISCVLFCADS